MKRLLALALCLVLAFTLCGCKDKKENKGTAVDIEYFANLGQIPENEIKLGALQDAVETSLEKNKTEAEKNGEHYVIEKQDGENNRLISDGTYEYYFKKAAPEKGICYMVSFTESFGFKIGEVILEVKNALADYEIKEEPATVENAFFHRGNIDNSVVLYVPFEKNTVLLLFEDNVLCATVIYSNDNWK